MSEIKVKSSTMDLPGMAKKLEPELVRGFKDIAIRTDKTDWWHSLEA